jgi:hypothetical protein
MTGAAIDTDKFRLRRFVERLVEMGEVEIHDEPVPLVGLAAIIEGTKKAVLFKAAGPERAEIVAKTGGTVAGSPPLSGRPRRSSTTNISAASPRRSRSSRSLRPTRRSTISSSTAATSI